MSSMNKDISTTSGVAVIGETEIRDKDKNLLVRFTSVDAEDCWGNFYEAQRIEYAMRNRRKTISEHYKTGVRPVHLKREAISLLIKNLLRR